MKYKLTILAVLLLAGVSFAQESISSGDSLSQGMKIIPPIVPLCSITTTSLPGGTQGVPYSAFVRTASCFPLVTFQVTSGALPSWAGLNHATGEISGIPDAGATTSFTIQATDGLGHHDQFSPNLTIVATSDGAPLPPDPSLEAFPLFMASTPANGPTICVGTPLDATQLPGGTCGTSFAGTTTGLQSALDGAVCGQIINVANLQGLGPVTLPSNTKCPATNWIWLSYHDLSDPVFPPEMTRIDPSFAGIPQSAMPQLPFPLANAGKSTARHMSQIVVPATSNRACLSLNVPTTGTNTPSIGHWRIMGLQCTRDQSSDALTALIDLNFQPGQTTTPVNPNQDCSIVNGLPVNAVQCQADQPEEIIIDRNLIEGDAQRQTIRGLSMGGGRNIFVINNFGDGIQSSFAGGQGDAEFFAGGFGRGYTKVGKWYFFNNETSSSTEGSLFCGAYTEPKNSATGADGVPTSVIWDHDWFLKTFLWDTQRGQANNETLINEGTIYPPEGDQEEVFNPLAFTIQQGNSFNLNNTWIHDSSGGWNRFNDAGGVGTVTVDGTDYKTVVSANGIVTKANVTVGVAPWQMLNIIQWKYTACSGAGTPIAACTAATTAGPHTLVFNGLVVDGRLGSLGNDRHIINTVTPTVTTGAPTNLIALTPSVPDLEIQPSYSDAFNNKRQFGYVFTAAMNFSSVSMTWKVDGTTNGSSALGQICSVTHVPCTAPGSNDASVVYVSGTALGSHTISVTSAAGTTASQPITVSTTSPIWAYDLKAMTEKNGWEAKCVNQGVLKNFIIENAHGSQGNGGGQDGLPGLNQAINQSSQVNDGNGVNVGYGPQNISDLLVDHGHYLHFADGFAVASLNQAKGVHRLTYSNLLLEDINTSRYSHGFLKPLFSVFLQYSGATCQTAPCTVLSWPSAANPLADNVFFKHITEVGGSTTTTGPGLNSWLSLANNEGIPLGTNAQFQLGPFAINDSIFQVPGTSPFVNNQGDTNDCNKANGSGASNTEALAFQGKGYIPALPCFSSYSLNRNALADNKTNPLNFTSTIWQPNSTDADLFIKSGDNGDYRIPFGSQYDAGGAKDASDGLALGADIDGIIKNDAEIRWGSTTPMSISTTTLPTATHGTAYSFLLTVTGGTGPYTWSAPAGVVPPGAIDTLDYAAMPLPDRNSFHLSGTIVKYFKLDAGLLWWVKGVSGNPWDGEMVGPDYIKQWFTENTFTNSSSFKMYVNPVSLWARYHIPGADDVVYTPGPNKYSTTDNCGADNQPLIDNLGVRGELTGPFTDVTWQTTYGGNIPDNTPYLLAQKWIKCTANNIANCTTEEDYWLVKGYGQVRWCPKTWNGSTYVTGTCTQETTKTAGGPVPPNFACGVPHPPATDGLPTGNLLVNQPPFTLGDLTGILSGTPNAVGTTKFTVQVEDSLGHVAQKTLSLTVQ